MGKTWKDRSSRLWSADHEGPLRARTIPRKRYVPEVDEDWGDDWGEGADEPLPTCAVGEPCEACD